MKKILLASSCMAIAAMANAQNVQGPSSSKTSYLSSVANGVKFTSIISVGDTANGYVMCGIPDGAGAYDNHDGTFTLLVNHEMGATAGAIRAHGSTGAFVSRWVIRKSDFSVLTGSDLIERVYLWDRVNSKYVMHNPTNPSNDARSGRYCSGDLPAVSAYYNTATGKGTKERIFMNGEETGKEGRGFAHIATGPNAGSTFELPYLGRYSWENAVANPATGDKTVVAGTDDEGGGQVYIYIGDKKNTGSEIEKAGLTAGKLYGIAVTGYVSESNANPPADGSKFTLYDFGQVNNMTGNQLHDASQNNGVTGWMRPEDAAWDPKNPTDLYVAMTNGMGSPSRLYRFRFDDINNMHLGGSVTAVLDGTEGQEMLDNIGIDNFGNILIVEDPGSDVRNARIWEYQIANDTLIHVGEHDATRFIPGGSSFITTNEEASGIFDAQEVLGAGWFLVVDQVHFSEPGQLVEGGQILAMYNPTTANANPEISFEGNSTNIPNGSNAPVTTNNTDFGNTVTGTNVTKTFTIKNAGPAALVVDSIKITGANAGEFTLVGAPTLPLNIAANGSQTLTVQFAPTAVGLRKANIEVKSNDFDESHYTVALQGVGLNPMDVENAAALSKIVKLFPNPTRDMATVAINLDKAQKVSITMVDLQGKVVVAPIQQELAAGEQKVNINTSNLANGNYYVVITAGAEITKIQLVVAR